MTLRDRQEEALVQSVGQLISEIDDMVAEADRMIRQTDDFFEELGIDRESTKRYLESDKVSHAERRRVLAQLEAWKTELRSEIDRARDQHRGERSSRKRPRGLHRVRV